MKKIFITLLLTLSIPSFAEETNSAKGEWIQMTIVGSWSMIEVYDEANVLDLKDDGSAILYLFECDNKKKKYTSVGEIRYTYKIKNGELLLKEAGDNGKFYKLVGIKRTSILSMELQYNMLESSLDKIKLYYIKTDSLGEIAPICTYKARELSDRLDSMKSKNKQ